jgi:F-box and WD-40 domain protein CDC4
MTNTFQVWSFAPPEDMLYDRPLSLQQRVLEDDPDRPASAMELEYRGNQTNGPSDIADAPMGDVDMQDAGPSTAPLQGGDQAFFRDA